MNENDYYGSWFGYTFKLAKRYCKNNIPLVLCSATKDDNEEYVLEDYIIKVNIVTS